jgi:hypothetical protein
MPIPAIRKVQLEIKSAIEAARPDLVGKGFTDRGNHEPFDSAECPAFNVRMIVDKIEYADDHANSLHRVTCQIDCHSPNSVAGTIDVINQTMIADIVGALHNARTAPTNLGIMTEDIEEESSDSSEESGVDIGCAVLQIAITYRTPRGDLYNIIGQNGQIF